MSATLADSLLKTKVDATNGITEQQFTDGKTFILSDSGIIAVRARGSGTSRKGA